MTIMNKLLSVAGVIALAVWTSGASANKADVTREMAEASAMVRSAERGGADAMATIELKAARNHLNSAKLNFDERDRDDAEFAAKKSQRDAELADAKT